MRMLLSTPANGVYNVLLILFEGVEITLPCKSFEAAEELSECLERTLKDRSKPIPLGELLGDE